MALGKLITVKQDDECEEKERDEALAAFGLVAEGPTVHYDTYYLWPECEEIFQFWCSLQRQWHRDINGRIVRLDYHAIDLAMKWECIPKKQQKELTRYIRAMGEAVLTALANQG